MARRHNSDGGVGETIRTLAYAVGIALVIRTLAFRSEEHTSELQSH